MLGTEIPFVLKTVLPRSAQAALEVLTADKRYECKEQKKSEWHYTGK
tara:strand:- start:287 stop:427 length:141 start_codon:yes stop_codon:yes gene_type:complete